MKNVSNFVIIYNRLGTFAFRATKIPAFRLWQNFRYFGKCACTTDKSNCFFRIFDKRLAPEGRHRTKRARTYAKSNLVPPLRALLLMSARAHRTALSAELRLAGR